jgi:hypothetical protein
MDVINFNSIEPLGHTVANTVKLNHAKKYTEHSLAITEFY